MNFFVPKNEVRTIKVIGKEFCVGHLEDGLFALQNSCPHASGPLGEGELLGGQIECPRHGARFDVKTGKVTCLPAVIPVKTYEVKIEGEEIKVKV